LRDSQLVGCNCASIGWDAIVRQSDAIVHQLVGMQLSIGWDAIVRQSIGQLVRSQLVWLGRDTVNWFAVNWLGCDSVNWFAVNWLGCDSHPIGWDATQSLQSIGWDATQSQQSIGWDATQSIYSVNWFSERGLLVPFALALLSCLFRDEASHDSFRTLDLPSTSADIQLPNNS
jgi:hypothetical protein